MLPGASLPYWLKRSSLVNKGLALHCAEKGRIGDNGLRLQFRVLRMLEGVFLLDVKLAVVDAVEDHVHPREVVGRAVHLLPVKHAHILYLPRHAQEQRTGAAGRVIDGLELLLARGHQLGKDLGDLLRGVKFASLLACAACKLPDEVFVGVAQDIGIGLLQLEVDLVEVGEHLGDDQVAGLGRLAEFGAVEVHVFKEVVKVLFAFGAHGTLLYAQENALEVRQDEACGGLVVGIQVQGIARAACSDLSKQIFGLEEVAKALQGLLLDGLEEFGGILELGCDLPELDFVLLQNAIRKEFHLLAEVLVEDEPEDVVPEFIGIHLAAQGIGDVPELLFQYALKVF